MAFLNRKTALRALWQGALLVLLPMAAGLAVNGLRPDGLPLLPGRGPANAAHPLPAADRLTIPLAEARQLFDDRAAVFIDARNTTDFQAGHISGALSLPWHQVHERFAAVADALDPQQAIITYCQGESCRLSNELALFLKELGFQRVRVLVNGWGVWRDNELPVETGGG